MPSGLVSHSLFSTRLFNLCDRRFLHRNTAVFVIAKFNDHIVICNVYCGRISRNHIPPSTTA